MSEQNKRLLQEADRVRKLLEASAVPFSCGPEYVVAPARGAFRLYRPTEMVPGSTERVRRTGWKGRDAIRACDAFDVMQAQAARRKQPHPLTPGQVEIGRDYGALVERLAAAGVRCSSVEAMSNARAGGGNWIEALMRDGRRLDAFRRRIGSGAALTVRRVRPSERGTRGARLITDKALVDAVCVYQMQLDDLLRSKGWSVKGDHRCVLRDALRAALDRMQGY